MQQGHAGTLQNAVGERGGRDSVTRAQNPMRWQARACRLLDGCMETKCNWHHSTHNADCMLRPAPSW
eukprot:9747056-Lingulodinium_polyedra.AAC.1